MTIELLYLTNCQLRTAVVHFLHQFSKEQVLVTDIQIVHICKIIDSLKDNSSLEKSCDKLKQHIKKQRHYFANEDLSSQSYGFSSSHVWM